MRLLWLYLAALIAAILVVNVMVKRIVAADRRERTKGDRR
jgi:hypothetical protein